MSKRYYETKTNKLVTMSEMKKRYDTWIKAHCSDVKVDYLNFKALDVLKAFPQEYRLGLITYCNNCVSEGTLVFKY